MSMSRVVIVGSARDFLAEFPGRGVGWRKMVRVSVTEMCLPARLTDRLRVSLSVQAVNGADEIVWLARVLNIPVLSGTNESVTDAAMELCKCLPQMAVVIRAKLAELGFEVRRGVYGIPVDIEAVNGDFREWVRWDVEAGRFVMVGGGENEVS